jgi:hypothetical protein
MFWVMKYILTGLIVFVSSAVFGQESNQSFGLTLSFPWANNYSFYAYDLKKTDSKSGFMGAGISFFYKEGKHKFSLNTGVTADIFAPLGPIDYAHEGTRSHISSRFAEILYHRNIFNRINLIGGIHVMNYHFRFISYVDTLPSYTQDDQVLGLTAGAEYQFGRNFYLAIIYRPSLIAFDERHYRHLLSLDARFDINIWKKKDR